MKETVVKKAPTSKKVALWLVIGPTGLFLVAVILFLLINFFTTLLTPMVPDTEQMTMPIGLVIINVMLSVLGVVAIVAWLPGLITGIVLLSKKK